MTLKIPSSVMLGSRPRIFLTRAYSSDVKPCSAAISGVTLISAGAMALTVYSVLQSEIRQKKRSGLGQKSRRRLCRANQSFDHRLENHEAIRGVQCRFDRPPRGRHQAGQITFAVANAGDVIHRAVGISARVIRTVRRRVAE